MSEQQQLPLWQVIPVDPPDLLALRMIVTMLIVDMSREWQAEDLGTAQSYVDGLAV